MKNEADGTGSVAGSGVGSGVAGSGVVGRRRRQLRPQSPGAFTTRRTRLHRQLPPTETNESTEIESAVRLTTMVVVAVHLLLR